ncbi:tRNA (adenosine(37)-N6)-threonylcarbamoyltransferase complex dimerization subunit type 1 TsaB [Microbacterium gorillae]|uniref:tRNA (adenosine(37)-N6)-threonylcarbamoyltransferase complex dimerization subunit type 1 TsaB n=1 Tax=Microbacterium gorillae TaxID=1231063 RepID=UPI00058B3FE5|nr:tRNA (adenosine(37)-N6)-threonylcarbamoyltransferase complex dimerization subunit type 1 TsaB [Microbacterium gorillae]
MILGIDTSLGTAVALIDSDGATHADLRNENPLGHAEIIGTMLVDALAAGPGEITHVAAGMGPGPFTGLRVGIAAARAFALGRGVPVVPVVTHDAVALELLTADPDTEPFAVVTDARRREFAYTVYSGLDADGLPIRVSEPALSPRDEVDARLAGLGARRHDATAVSAAMLARVAGRAIAADRVVGPDDALYLRSPDVKQPSAPKRVSA